MTAELNLAADARIEFGFGTVTAGKEAWMYGEYFPYMAPTMADHELSILAGFVVVETNFVGGDVQSGSIASWPSAANREALHNDPRFLKIQPDRDAAMDFLTGGHLFHSLDDVVSLNTDRDYAIIVTDDIDAVSDPILVLPFASDGPEQTYTGKSLILRPWGVAEEALLKSPPAVAEVFRVRFSESSK